MSRAIEQVRDMYFTIGNAAKELGVTRMTLWRWMQSNKLQGYRLGREIFIEKADIERLKRERAG